MLRSLVSIAIFGLLTGVANAQTGQSSCNGGTIRYWNNFWQPPASYAEYWIQYLAPSVVLTSNSQIVRMAQCGRGGVVTKFSDGEVYFSPDCYNIGGGG